MVTLKCDNEEKHVLGSYEWGEWKSVKNLKEEIENTEGTLVKR